MEHCNLQSDKDLQKEKNRKDKGGVNQIWNQIIFKAEKNVPGVVGAGVVSFVVAAGVVTASDNNVSRKLNSFFSFFR